MADHAERAHVAAIIASVAVRGWAEQTRLTAMLRRSCWPGAGDRTDPAAREWLRHWGPQGIALSGPGCTCAEGRCMVCN